MITTPLVHHSRLRPGLTILELTVVIAVFLTLISVLYLGVKAYKSGSDRANCVMNIHSLQNAVRSYSNLNGVAPGESLPHTDLRAQLIGPDRFIEEIPNCPGGGAYSFLGNRIPDQGELYLSCSLATDERHQPERMRVW